VSCPLCTIPSREGTLYKDEVCYIQKTKEQRGHILRVMVVLNRHAADPTADEFAHCMHKLQRFMEGRSPTQLYYMVFGTYASIPEHYHIIGADDVLDAEEFEKLFSSEYVRCVIWGTRRRWGND